jgi:hypothetical protein
VRGSPRGRGCDRVSSRGWLLGALHVGGDLGRERPRVSPGGGVCHGRVVLFAGSGWQVSAAFIDVCSLQPFAYLALSPQILPASQGLAPLLSLSQPATQSTVNATGVLSPDGMPLVALVHVSCAVTGQVSNLFTSQPFSFDSTAPVTNGVIHDISVSSVLAAVHVATYVPASLKSDLIDFLTEAAATAPTVQSLDLLNADWSAAFSDPQSGIDSYSVCVGTSARRCSRCCFRTVVRGHSRCVSCRCASGRDSRAGGLAN